MPDVMLDSFMDLQAITRNKHEQAVPYLSFMKNIMKKTQTISIYLLRYGSLANNSEEKNIILNIA